MNPSKPVNPIANNTEMMIAIRQFRSSPPLSRNGTKGTAPTRMAIATVPIRDTSLPRLPRQERASMMESVVADIL